PDPERERTVSAISAISWSLPVASVMLVALAATRGFGGVVPFNLIGSVFLPTARPLGIVVVTALGGATTAAALAWAGPFVAAAMLALVVLARRIRRFEVKALPPGATGSFRPGPETHRALLGFALPRTLASGLEQAIVWSSVPLVGYLAGDAAAGVYGTAARFVAAGMIVLTALRIVVAPRFSEFLGQGDTARAQRLYTVTAGWILLLGAPVYVVAAVFAPTVLSWFGPGFVEGASSMQLLCLGALALLAGGNVQSMLLMSGRTGWGAVNKAIVFAANIVGTVVLVPELGYLGAAVSWAACMTLDTSLALLQVYRFTRVRASLLRILAILILVAVCVGAPALAIARLWGNDSVSLLLAVVVGGILFAGAGWVFRGPLHLADMMSLRRHQRAAPATRGPGA
ncbi:MAG: polysaccharide biosynthesis C-terminal domain-containing protein, partial [Nocardioides sp.]